MKAHIGIVTWNRLHLTQICLESLFAKTRGNFTCTVVDNGSSDGTIDYLKALSASTPNVTIRLLSRNMGVSVASNLAWDDAGEADFFVKLDNDVEILDSDWLVRLEHLYQENPTIGPLGYKLCSWHTGSSHTLSDGTKVLTVPCCNGACACIPRPLFEKLGFWNEGYGVYGFEDLDYSWRALRVGSLPVYADVEKALVHHGKEPKERDTHQEMIKLSSRTAAISGTESYLLHLFLFEKGILPLKTIRKYIPIVKDGFYTFKINNEYKKVQKLINTLVKTINITQDGETSRLDLRGWKQEKNSEV
ncbi:MAG: glycosyltransferase family 2 protein [Desulfovibrio sp.]|nr:glycosyltransferase family 2 protein [Desulfovibrio sp.]